MKGEIYSAIKVAKLPPAPRITAPPITPAAKNYDSNYTIHLYWHFRSSCY